MRLFGVVFLLTLVPHFARAMGDVTTQTERGFLSVDFTLGYQQSRLMGSDGSMATYTGYLGGGDIDVKLLGAGSGEFRVFGSYLIGDATGDSSNEIKRTETLLGVKIFANNWLFLALGAGHIANKVSSSSTKDLSMDASITAMGGGVELPLGGGSWFWSLGAWYKSGAIKKSDNATYTGNSFFDGAELQLNLIWSPPATTINMSRK